MCYTGGQEKVKRVSEALYLFKNRIMYTILLPASGIQFRLHVMTLN